MDILTGSVAGLATITPCAGYVTPTQALVIGAIAGIVCNIAVDFRKKKGWDDALDVWGVHGIGGFTGTILIGIFGTGVSVFTAEGMSALLVQILGVCFVALYAFVVTRIILIVISKMTRIETTAEEQKAGLDQTFFHESTYNE